jgi:hypothetical protein
MPALLLGLLVSTMRFARHRLGTPGERDAALSQRFEHRRGVVTRERVMTEGLLLGVLKVEAADGASHHYVSTVTQLQGAFREGSPLG